MGVSISGARAASYGAWRRQSFVALSVAVGSLGVATGALAQSRNSWHVRPGDADGPLTAVVSIGQQNVRVYDRRGLFAQSPISSGTKGHETPEGVFSIIEKNEEHYSNLYDDASMPFMQRLTWSGVALHAGYLPGYPASHGCIRLPHAFAERLFEATKLNTRVVVVPGETEPVAFAHPALFQPKLVEIERPLAGVRGGRKAERLERTNPVGGAPMGLGVPAAGDAPLTERVLVTAREAALIEQARAQRRAQDAVKAAQAARLAHRRSVAALYQAQRQSGVAEYVRQRAVASLKQIERWIAVSRPGPHLDKLRANFEKAQAAAIRSIYAADAAKAAYVERNAATKAALAAIKTTELASIAAINAAKDSSRLSAPISVLVSRKTGKVYIRQNRQAVAEFPVEIRDAARPIGTHVFTAVAEGDGGRSVEWRALSIQSPEGSVPAEAELRPIYERVKVDRWRYVTRLRKPDIAPQATEGIASAALDRISLPAAALARITPYVQTGASLMISDLGPSVETGLATDFVVQTRGEQESIQSQIEWARKRAREARENGSGRRRRTYD
ncbi:MAG: L,D-transpeptidase family protein [Hyphomicrobiaceae bacterium]